MLPRRGAAHRRGETKISDNYPTGLGRTHPDDLGSLSQALSGALPPPARCHFGRRCGITNRRDRGGPVSGARSCRRAPPSCGRPAHRRPLRRAPTAGHEDRTGASPGWSSPVLQRDQVRVDAVEHANWPAVPPPARSPSAGLPDLGAPYRRAVHVTARRTPRARSVWLVAGLDVGMRSCLSCRRGLPRCVPRVRPGQTRGDPGLRDGVPIAGRPATRGALFGQAASRPAMPMHVRTGSPS